MRGDVPVRNDNYSQRIQSSISKSPKNFEPHNFYQFLPTDLKSPCQAESAVAGPEIPEIREIPEIPEILGLALEDDPMGKPP